MNEITITNETDEYVDEALLNKVADYAMKSEDVNNGVVNIIIVDNKKIREINKEYRKIDKETDVISFALEDDDTFIELPIRVLGDIYIASDCAIGANAVVTKSITEEGTTWAGVPAKKISSNNSHLYIAKEVLE